MGNLIKKMHSRTVNEVKSAIPIELDCGKGILTKLPPCQNYCTIATPDLQTKRQQMLEAVMKRTRDERANGRGLEALKLRIKKQKRREELQEKLNAFGGANLRWSI